MKCHIPLGISILALAAGFISFTAPPAAASAACPALPQTGVAFAQGKVTGGGNDGVLVYAVDTETGGMRCVPTGAQGAYTVPLPGVGNGRAPSDGWIIIANPPPGSSLGGASRMVPPGSVGSPGVTVTGQDLFVQTATLSVVPYFEQKAYTAASVACLVSRDTGAFADCGLSQVRDGLPAVRLTVPGEGSFGVDVFAKHQERWLDGEYAGEPFQRGDLASVDVVLSPEAVPTCPQGTTAVQGVVQRQTDDGPVPVRASIEAEASWNNGQSTGPVGEARSGRDGSYRLCVTSDYLPSDISLGDTAVEFRAAIVAGGTTLVQPWDKSQPTLDLVYPRDPQAGGTMSYDDDTPATSVNWQLSRLITGPGYSYMGMPVAYGKTDVNGHWGVAGLDDTTGTFVLQAYPRGRNFALGKEEFTFVVTSTKVDLAFQPGNFIGRLVLPTDPSLPNAFASVSVSETGGCGQQDQVPCSYYWASSDPEGYFTLRLPPGDYVVNAYPGWDLASGESIRSIVRTSFTISVSGKEVTCSDPCTLTADGPIVTMRPTNATLRILMPQEGKAPIPAPGSLVSIERWLDAGDDWPWRDGEGFFTDEDGLVRAGFESGIYRISVSPPKGALLPAASYVLRATVTGDAVSMEECHGTQSDPCGQETPTPWTVVDGAWDITFPMPNLIATITSPQGSPVAFARYTIQRVVGSDNNREFRWVTGAEADSSGALAANFDQTGFYQVTIDQPWQAQEDWVSRSVIYYRDDAGVCRVLPGTMSPCTTSGPLTDTVSFGLPNVSGVVLGAGGEPITNAWMEISRSCNDFPRCRQPFAETPGASVSESGRFQLNLPDDDTYILTVWPWNVTDGSTRTSFTLRINPGDSFTGEDSLTYQLKGANVTGTVQTAEGAKARWSWVAVEQYVGTFPFGNWQWLDAGGQVDQKGKFGLALDPGTYRLRIEPGPDWRGVATTTYDDSFTLITADDKVVRDVTLNVPNVRGRVMFPDPQGPAANAWVEARKWHPAQQQYLSSQDVGGSGTTEEGRFGLNLPDGRWELVANPPWGNTSATRASVKVLSCGESIVLDSDRDATCSDAPLGDELQITLGTPNVSGLVKNPDGELVRNTWVDIQAWNSQNGRYEWAPGLEGVSVSDKGAFATTLADGQYKITAYPGFGDSLYAKGSQEIWVQGQSTCLSGISPCPPEDSVDPGTLTVHLARPNVTGVVVATPGGGDFVSFAPVQVERWESDHWQWTDIWANTSQAGAYSLNLPEVGAYRLVAWPNAQYSAYVRGFQYVFRADNGLCSLPSEEAAQKASSCGEAQASLDLPLHLSAANLTGTVRDAQGSPVPQSWVEVMKSTSYGFEWVDGASTNEQGRFAISLQPGSPPQEYRLWVNPSWQNDAGLTRTSVDVIAYSNEGDMRVCRKSEWSGGQCSPDGQVSVESPLAVTLSGGNVRGIVRSPYTMAGVANTSASVEKWEETPWNPGSGTYTWAGTSHWANTRANGMFALSLDEPGIYRIGATPPWDEVTDSLANGSSIIKVLDTFTEGGSRQWCSVEDSSGDSADPFGDCTSGASGDDSLLLVLLRKPNVSTKIVDANGAGVQNAWVSLRKAVDQNGWANWQWLGGDSTRQGGTFNAVIDDSGTYSLDVFPPWDAGTSFARFSKDFTVTCPGLADPDVCDVQGLNETLAFPSPNVTGSVASPRNVDVLLANSWVSVERWNEGDAQDPNDGFYQWTDQGASTNRQGNFALRLSEDDTYRLTANPSWQNPEGLSTSAIVVVTGEGSIVSCVQGCVSGLKIQLRSPNLTGTVDDAGTLMAYSWVEVRQSGNWIAGTGTDSRGRYAFSLPPGTYDVWAFPNWNLSTKPPRSMSVTIAEQGTQSVDIDLSKVDPNITLCLNLSTVIGGTATTPGDNAVPVSTSRAVIVERYDNGDYGLLPEYTAQTASGNEPCAAQVQWNLPDGQYRFSVMPNLDDSFTTDNVSVPITLLEGKVENSDDTVIPAVVR